MSDAPNVGVTGNITYEAPSVKEVPLESGGNYATPAPIKTDVFGGPRPLASGDNED